MPDHKSRPIVIAPPASPEVREWMRRVIRGAHYVPQAGMYESMTPVDEAYIVKGMCSSLLVSVRQEMVDAGELTRGEDGNLHIGPEMPAHPMGTK